MSSYPAGQIEANGVTIPVTVTDTGRWEAEYDGRTQSYESRDKLETRLKSLTRRAAVTVAVSVVEVEEKMGVVTSTRATVTGIHGANGNILVTKHFGGRRGDVKEQVSVRYQHNAGLWFGGDVTDEQLAQYQLAVTAEREARETRQRLESRLSINLSKTTERAVAAVSGSDGE